MDEHSFIGSGSLKLYALHIIVITVFLIITSRAYGQVALDVPIQAERNVHQFATPAESTAAQASWLKPRRTGF